MRYNPLTSDYLCDAAKRGHLNIVKFVFSRLNGISEYDKSEAMNLACLTHGTDIIDYLHDDKINVDRHTYHGLYWACGGGMTKTVKRLISYGMWIDPMDHDLRCSPLITAVKNGYISIVKLLLKSGADPNSFDGEAFVVALENKDNDMIELLNVYKIE
jgi:ankyrin repeat protein